MRTLLQKPAPSSDSAAGPTVRRLTFLLLAVSIALAIWVVGVPGLAPEPDHALALLAFASVLWVSGLGSLGTVTLFTLALFVALKVVPAATGFVGFTNDATWLVIGSFFIARSVSKVGLDRRIAYAFMRTSSGSYTRLVLAIWGSAAVLGLAIPSAMARMAVFLPISQGIMKILDAKPGSKLASNFEWTVLYAVGGAAIFSFPSMLPMVVSLGVLSAQFGVTVSYATYLEENVLPSLIYFVVMFAAIHLIFRPRMQNSAEYYKDFVQARYRELGRFKPEELRALSWMLLTIGAWVVGGFYGVPTGIVALLFGCLLFTPQIGVLEVGDLGRINWDIAIFVGGVLSVSSIMIYSGLTGFLETTLIQPLIGAFMGSMGNYLGYAAGSDIFTVIATFVIPGNIAATAVFSPPLLSFAQSSGINLRFAAYNNGLSWILTGFFPYQQLLLLIIWPLGGIRSFAECAKHSTYLFLPRLLVLLLAALAWQLAMHAL